MIEANGVTRRFGRFTAVDDATFEVPAGRVAGFLGPNGAGKTTTLKMLSGLLRPDAGRLSVAGKDPQRQREAVLAGTGVLIETPGFFEHASALENLLWLGSLGRREPPEKLRPRALECLESLDMARHAARPVAGFSTGMRMRLALSVALVNRPGVLMLDEPTAGLDPIGRRAVRELILGANRSNGSTVFISSHLLEEVEVICDWLVVIEAGKIIAQGKMSELLPTTGESHFSARLEPADGAASVLGTIPEARAVEREGAAITFRARREDVPRIVARLIEKDVRLHELRDLGRSLEEFYFNLTRAKTAPPEAVR
ncbi:MAG: ABC transporter ATP-binding protein [Candidatus Wallbacteria bacterium]|nr:ABC transporter ATP-binding protein [Candidatus Wallbacteria bacterium]